MKSVLPNPWPGKLNVRTVMNTFGDCLENFHVERGSTPVIPIVLVLIITDDTVCSFESGQLDGGRLGYPGNNLTGIERENRRIRIDGIGIEYFWKVRRLEDWFGEV